MECLRHRLDILFSFLRSKVDVLCFSQVMIDDTESKLAGQPDSLINPPTFNYPLGPSAATTASLLDKFFPTTASLLDTFLLQLVAALDELSTESNFAFVIRHQGWYENFGTRGDEFARKGVQILCKANISVEAEKRGKVLLPAHARTFKIGTTVVVAALSARRPFAAQCESSWLLKDFQRYLTCEQPSKRACPTSTSRQPAPLRPSRWTRGPQPPCRRRPGDLSLTIPSLRILLPAPTDALLPAVPPTSVVPGTRAAPPPAVRAYAAP